jgi:hypothetical protein
MRLVALAAKLLRHYPAIAVRRRFSPDRASAIPYRLQHIYGRSNANYIQRQARRDLKVRRSPCGKPVRVLLPAECYRVIFVIVAEEEKPPFALFVALPSSRLGNAIRSSFSEVVHSSRKPGSARSIP